MQRLNAKIYCLITKILKKWKGIQNKTMDERYPFYHPCYTPPERRTMKQVKRDYNKYLKKFEVSKVKAK